MECKNWVGWGTDSWKEPKNDVEVRVVLGWGIRIGRETYRRGMAGRGMEK